MRRVTFDIEALVKSPAIFISESKLNLHNLHKLNNIYVVESHHQVLPAWASYRCQLSQSPRLITLDHHTDTSRPFRNYLKRLYGSDSENTELLRKEWLNKIKFLDADSVMEAMQKISNDEHVVTAIQTDIISSALVVAHNARDTDLETYREHKIICRAVDRRSSVGKMAREDYDQVLETKFLEEVLSSFDQLLKMAGELSLESAPYILDIDLDYFNTFNSVNPKDAGAFQKLIAGAGLVTIATEPEYVKSCALDLNLSSEGLLSTLTSRFLDPSSEIEADELNCFQ